MSISIGLFDEHKIMLAGVSSILSPNEDLVVLFQCADKAKLLETIKSHPINILIVNIHALDTAILNLITQINLTISKTRVLVISAATSDVMVLKTIKAGAKGYLAREADREEMIEAIYTIRNGFDYYSKSITHLLINKYITRFKSEDKIPKGEIENLSARQIEILKLWGENYTNKEMAEKLFISLRTVETHKNHIMQKLNLKSTVDMVKFAIRNNLIEI
ncbi:MAG: response regulator transcription factor [Breznakibacter sp.]|jgi:DNA-binding NarL/FixJ family response regulator|nr:response regulator transcription factor [Breznakibacter sp.]